MTNTHERQKRAARPSEMFPPGGHSLSHAQGFGHRGFQRSRGKTFATAAGTCGARALRKSSEGKRMSMTIVGVEGRAEPSRSGAIERERSRWPGAVVRRVRE
ncbi:amino acid ABC transporter substrate-binding protein, PAAT family [Burkholderia sp. ABCPW 111]|nr:amino acid ABC transporter substrate-binding protein, PAAT family [Burkholderia sp. ABCPW 111]KVK87998.1 hypothetical protein WS91_30360 [Burkholderia sp. MSMB1498]